MTPVDVLRGARELITEEEAWCQGLLGLRTDGDKFVAWCAVQAVWHVADLAYDLGWATVDALQQTVGSEVAVWNDHPQRTHADVLDAYDRTIARLENEHPPGDWGPEDYD